MKTPPFLIVADRGELKAYVVEPAAGRAPMPRLLKNVRLSEPHQKFAERFTDQAGAFPNRGTDGQGNSAAERMTLVAEDELRCFRRLAGEITTLLKEHRPERWAFAAPSEINGAIIDGLAPALRSKLAKNLPQDLIHIEAAELLSHFDAED